MSLKINNKSPGANSRYLIITPKEKTKPTSKIFAERIMNTHLDGNCFGEFNSLFGDSKLGNSKYPIIPKKTEPTSQTFAECIMNTREIVFNRIPINQLSQSMGSNCFGEFDSLFGDSKYGKAMSDYIKSLNMVQLQRYQLSEQSRVKSQSPENKQNKFNQRKQLINNIQQLTGLQVIESQNCPLSINELDNTLQSLNKTQGEQIKNADILLLTHGVNLPFYMGYGKNWLTSISDINTFSKLAPCMQEEFNKILPSIITSNETIFNITDRYPGKRILTGACDWFSLGNPEDRINTLKTIIGGEHRYTAPKKFLIFANDYEKFKQVELPPSQIFKYLKPNEIKDWIKFRGGILTKDNKIIPDLSLTNTV